MKQYIFLLGLAISGTSISGPLDFKEEFLKSLAYGLQTQTVKVEDVASDAVFLVNPFDSGAVKIHYHSNFDVVTRVTFKKNESEKISLGELKQYSFNFARMYSDKFSLDNGVLDYSNAKFVQLNRDIAMVTFPFLTKDRVVRDAYFQMTFSKNSDGTYARRSVRNHTFSYLPTQSPMAGSDAVTLKSVTGMDDFSIELIKSEWFADELNSVLIPATRFFFKDLNGGKYQLAVNDLTKEIIEAEKREYQKTKALRPGVWGRSYLDAVTSFAILPFTPFVITGVEYQTKGDGTFDVEGETAATVILRNERTSIHDGSFNEIAYRYDVPLTDETITLSELDRRATNAYVAVNDINLYVRSHLLPSETTYLNRRTPVRINYRGSCNAFYDGQISLFDSGGGCANMAEVNDVIYHEWGHGLDDFTGRNEGIQDGAFSEGIGDIVAAYYTNSSNMGQGFFADKQQGIRQLDNQFRYPEDRGEVHDEGRIIAGAFWDMRQALINRYGDKKGHYKASEYFLRHLLIADNYTESYEIVLTLDDDDGDANSQSPNFCLITEAFAKHGLAPVVNGCVDDNFNPAVPVHADLKMAYVTDATDAEKKYVLASLATKDQVNYCFNKDVCGSDAKSMKLDGTKNGLFVFKSEALTSEPSNHSVIRFEIVGNGKVKSARNFKIVYR